MNDKRCARCKRRHALPNDDLCDHCRYRAQVDYMNDLPADLQDWEFAVCEECGSSLDDNGECRNTSCGNSPYQGEDWI